MIAETASSQVTGTSVPTVGEVVVPSQRVVEKQNIQRRWEEALDLVAALRAKYELPPTSAPILPAKTAVEQQVHGKMSRSNALSDTTPLFRRNVDAPYANVSALWVPQDSMFVHTETVCQQSFFEFCKLGFHAIEPLNDRIKV